jgi:hypothetical protein
LYFNGSVRNISKVIVGLQAQLLTNWTFETAWFYISEDEMTFDPEVTFTVCQTELFMGRTAFDLYYNGGLKDEIVNLISKQNVKENLRLLLDKVRDLEPNPEIGQKRRYLKLDDKLRQEQDVIMQPKPIPVLLRKRHLLQNSYSNSEKKILLGLANSNLISPKILCSKFGLARTTLCRWDYQMNPKPYQFLPKPPKPKITALISPTVRIQIRNYAQETRNDYSQWKDFIADLTQALPALEVFSYVAILGFLKAKCGLVKKNLRIRSKDYNKQPKKSARIKWLAMMSLLLINNETVYIYGNLNTNGQ